MSENPPTTSRFVEYSEYGGPEVLELIEVPVPAPVGKEVQIQVVAAGLNPVDYKIFHGGPIAEAFGAKLPSGVGNDVAGTVVAIGPEVSSFAIGDKVFAAARNRALADVVTVSEAHVLPIPEGLDINVAGGLWIVGRTASAVHDALDIKPGETVLVIGAAGGVGAIAAQLAKLSGARVIGTASEANHEYLRSLGITPVTYGPGQEQRIRDLGELPTKAIDTHGPDGVDLALSLGNHPGTHRNSGLLWPRSKGRHRNGWGRRQT